MRVIPHSSCCLGVGLGHGTIDAGGGYTYFDPQTGHEFSDMLGFTYNFENQSTQYQSGVDMHFDWSASQFVTKQFQIGAVGYVYKEIGISPAAPSPSQRAPTRMVTK